MISKFIDNLWRPRRNKHHRRLKRATTPIVATEKLEDRTLLSGQDLVAFAQALTAANVTLYGAAWDADTTAQKALLEDGAQFLQFVEITDANRDLNANAASVGITDNNNWQPIWTLNNVVLTDPITNLQELSTATGVAIPMSNGPFLKEISDQNLLSGTGLHVALDGYDPENGPLTYTVESSNANVSARILTGNRSLRISVEGYGDMVFELFEGRASRAAERIIQLAQSDFYSDVIFHRIVNNFVIQGGDPTGTGAGGSILGFFDDQFHPELQHVQTGLLAMAKAFDDTNDSQFFITEGASRSLDFQHTIFGYLIEGEDVREAISNLSVTGETPNFTISMETVEVFTDLENATLFLTAAEGYSGSSTITVTVEDQDGLTQQRQFLVNVTPDTISNVLSAANANPYLADIPTLQVIPGQSVIHQLQAIDIDLTAPNGNLAEDIVYLEQSLLDYNGLPVPVVAPSGLIYTVDSNTGLLTVSPSAGLAAGAYQITVAVGFHPSDIDYQVVTVIVSTPPVANDDFFALQGNTPSPIDIIANDTDSDGSIDPATIEIVTQPTHGTVTTNPDGTVNFIADASGYMGVDSFTYRVKDSFGAYSNVATVNFSLAPEGVILVTLLTDQIKADQKVTLREAIIAANSNMAFDAAPAGNGPDTIMFDPALDFSNPLQLLTEITITDSLTVIAPTSPEGDPLLTIDLNQDSRHFSINDGLANTLQVSLQNLKLVNGQVSENGGSIFNSEHLVIANSELLNNQSTSGLGGAIYNTGTLTILNSLIQNNRSLLSSGGAIASVSGSVSLDQTIVDDNDSEGFGGGIYGMNADISLMNSIVSNNSSFIGGGGGIYQNAGLLTVTNSSLISNTVGSASEGGGIHAIDTTSTITGSTFHNNQSSGSGGGLHQLEGTLSVRNSTFSENSALFGNGAGLHTAADTVSIVNSTISGNSSAQNGGGIHFADVLNFTSGIINNSTIANNDATQDGGGIHSPFQVITVNNTIIADNTASGSGADVLGFVAGSHSLIENTNGLTIQGGVNFITGQDPGLLPLADNGGLTLTHALASGSIAIDAGDSAFDPNSFTPALTLDQRGSARVADGNNDSTVQIDIGAYEAESVLGSSDLTVKWQPTNVGPSGIVNSLPANADFLDEWNPVVVEIWVSVTNSSENGLTAANIDFQFDAQYLTVDAIEYGPGFTENQTGTIDNGAGTITGLGASTNLTGHGAETLVLLARVQLSVNPVPLNANGQHIQAVANLNFQIANSTLTSSLGDVTVTEGAATNLTLVPALYDLNDNGSIDFRDLILFAAVYSKSTGDPESPNVWAADFDRSGTVDFRDLILLATNYGKIQGSGEFFIYPSNFSDVWQQNNLVTSQINLQESQAQNLAQQNIEPVLNAAKNDLAKVHGDAVHEKLADVEIKLVELPGTQLAKAEPETNTIYLDINAAGWGWFVDSTPLLNEEFNESPSGIFDAALFSTADGYIDLLTVLIHELNHLLGQEHTHESPVLESELDPGVRKLASQEKILETDNFFGHYLDPEFQGII
ncbi:peptidylprolyl isomerase [uncultured Gimesia sp.]|uniref:peptidylprolyl isomerase n=1 Tax=uncultured Gimesia sp. TaxID=1678688 RepID=UPI002627164A|nr:peptidylprolyl isomerase [uncultured Gimesia sp.]